MPNNCWIFFREIERAARGWVFKMLRIKKLRRSERFFLRCLVANTTFAVIVSGFVIGGASAARRKLAFRRLFPAEGTEWGLGTGSRSFAFWRTGGGSGGERTRRCWRPGRTARWCGYMASADGTQIANGQTHQSSYLSTANWLVDIETNIIPNRHNRHSIDCKLTKTFQNAFKIVKAHSPTQQLTRERAVVKIAWLINWRLTE